MRKHRYFTKLMMLGVLTTGAAVGLAADLGYGEPGEFLQDVRKAQLDHLDFVPDLDAMPRVVEKGSQQAFGREGGLLNDIWRAHFQPWSRAVPSPRVQPRLSRLDASFPGFLDDVWRIHFSHLGV